MAVNEGKTNYCPNGTELVGDADDKDGTEHRVNRKIAKHGNDGDEANNE